MRGGATGRRLLKFLLWGAVAIALFAATVVVAIELGLRTKPMREAMVSRLVPRMEKAYGVRVELDDFSLSLFAAELEIRALELSVPGSEPFARVERIGASFRPFTLLAGRLGLEELVIERPVIDLVRPLPEITASEPIEAEAAKDLPVAIERLSVTEAMVAGSSLPSDGSVLSSWSLADGEIEGSLDGSSFRIGSLTAELGADLAARGPIEVPRVDLELAAEVTGRLGGAIELDRVAVQGEALNLEAAGRLGDDPGHSNATFEAELDPGFWLGRPGATPVAIEGVVDLGTWSGGVRVQAPEISGDLLRGLLDPTVFEQLELAGTTGTLEATFELSDSDLVDGSTQFVATRDSETILEVTAEPRVRLPNRSLTELFFEVEATATALPEWPGVRTVTLEASGSDLSAPEEWRAEFAIRLPDVAGAARSMASRWPRLVAPETVAALPSLGEISMIGSLSGEITDPLLESRVDWWPHPGGEATASVAGPVVSGAWAVESEGSGLDLSRFAEELGGRLEWTGRVSGGLERPQGGVHVAVWDLSSDGQPLFDVLDVRVSGERSRVEWAFDGSLPEWGQLEGKGSIVPARLIGRSEGRATLTPRPESLLGERLDLVEATFELTGGALAVEASGFRSGSEVFGIDANLPLESLAGLPGAEALAGLPLEQTPGLLDLSWTIARDDWATVLPEVLQDKATSFSLGSVGRVELDVDCPACSRASSEVTGFSAVVAGRSVSASEPLVLALGDGLLRLGPWAVEGPDLSVSLDAFAELEAAWRLAEKLDGLVIDSAFSVGGEIGSAWLEGLLEPESGIEIVSPGTMNLQADGRWSGGALSGEATFGGQGLIVGLKGQPALTAAEPRAVVRYAEGALELEQASFRVGDGVLTADAHLPLDALYSGGSGSLRLEGAVPVVELFELPFEIADGRLVVADGRLSTPGGDGVIRVDLPLEHEAGREATVQWNLPPVDWSPLAKLLSGLEDPERLVVGTSGEAAIDLDRPAASNLAATLSEATVTMRGRSTTLESPVSLSVADGVLSLPAISLVSGDEVFTVEGDGKLAPDWTPAEPLGELVARAELSASGTLDFGLMNPFLSGGRAEGPLAVDLAIEGSLDDLSGDARLSGPEASLLYRVPYLARISEPDLRLRLQRGRVTLEEGSARLNNGPLQLSGTLLEDGQSELGVRFEDALFRLDYGLLTTVGGDLRVEAVPDEETRVSGKIVVQRGSLTRDVQLDFDLLTELLAPIDLSTTEDDPLARIALDVAVETREGVRVRNNLGDLLVRWEPIQVSGSVARPILKGEVEVDPGGLLYAYGQTVRLDRAVIEYPGGELDEPRLELEVTTSLEDPTIVDLAGDDPFRARTQRPDDEQGADVTGDLALYYGEQFASRVGESLGAKISLRPLLIFGEADPGARLTVSRDFSPNFAVAASVDLRNAESRTYLLEAHEVRSLPGLVGQAFTDDDSAYGGALLQRLEWGGSETISDADLPRLGKISVDKVPGVSKRGLKRALGLKKGEPFAPEDQFAAEVELIDYLLGKGFPNAAAEIAAHETGRKGRKVRLDVTIDPGPHAEFEFTGEEIPKPLRKLIRSYYRTDFFEPESIEAMRDETVRALRSQGFLEPKVTVAVEPVDRLDPNGDRRVLVSTEGGVRMSPEAPVFQTAGSDELEAVDLADLAAVFFGPVQRVELAQGLAGADARLLKALADIGYSQGKIVNRFMSLDEKRLTVVIEPGPRTMVSVVTISDGSELDTEPLEKLLAVRDGEPLRRRRLALSALRIEQALADQGYLEARVRTVLGVTGADEEGAVPVRFEVDRGEMHSVEAVEFSGLESTREGWAARTAALEPGQPLVRGDLAQARTRLWRTGIFSSVGTETETLGGGRQRVVFDLAERDRYRLAYGVRWDSEDGSSAVFDVTDENFLGRQWTLGLRMLYSDDDKSARWLTRVPRVGGGRGSLELFALSQELIEFGIISDILEGTLQYSLPLGERTTLRTYGRYRDTKLSEEDPDPFFPLDERIKSPLLGWQFLYNSRGAELFPQRGVFFSIDLSGSEEFLGSDFRYARLFTQMNLFRKAGRLLERPLRWAQSYRIGVAQAFDQELLRDVRFFAGGEYSVRGYETESLGPQETLGSIVRPLGGEALLVVNQELHWRLFADYSLLVFGDFGNVWDDVSDFGTDLFSSVGLGLRAATPIGLIRLDVARPLDRREGLDSEYAIYFGLGSTF